MLKFENCTFSATGTNKKDKVFGLTVRGNEPVVVEDCIFNGTGYAGILNNGANFLTVVNSKFYCTNLYNPIEGSQTVENAAVDIEDCEFFGIPGNNFINFYNVADSTTHEVKNCKFHGGTSNNIIRLSNKNNVSANFVFENLTYEFTSGTVNDYTGFLLCQDYTNHSGTKQDFSKYAVTINNLTHPEEGSLIYVYEDGQGIITTNYPAVTVDGSPLLFGEEN